MSATEIEVIPLGVEAAARIAVIGDLDDAGGQRARRKLAQVVDTGAINLVIDLDRIGAIESAGLAALIATLRRARGRGGDVRVQTSQPRIRRLMELTGLSRVFRMSSCDVNSRASAA